MTSSRIPPVTKCTLVTANCAVLGRSIYVTAQPAANEYAKCAAAGVKTALSVRTPGETNAPPYDFGEPATWESLGIPFANFSVGSRHVAEGVRHRGDDGRPHPRSYVDVEPYPLLDRRPRLVGRRRGACARRLLLGRRGGKLGADEPLSRGVLRLRRELYSRPPAAAGAAAVLDTAVMDGEAADQATRREVATRPRVGGRPCRGGSVAAAHDAQGALVPDDPGGARPHRSHPPRVVARRRRPHVRSATCFELAPWIDR